MSEFLDSLNLNLSTSGSSLSDEEEWQKLESGVPRVPPTVRTFVSTDPGALFPAVIVVGGGPVGLWTTIQLAIRCVRLDNLLGIGPGFIRRHRRPICYLTGQS